MKRPGKEANLNLLISVPDSTHDGKRGKNSCETHHLVNEHYLLIVTTTSHYMTQKSILIFHWLLEHFLRHHSVSGGQTNRRSQPS